MEERMTESNLTRISDLYLAAYFLASDVPLWVVDRENPRRVEFLFEGRHDPLLISWAGATATINAVKYAGAIRRARRLLYRDDDPGNG